MLEKIKKIVDNLMVKISPFPAFGMDISDSSIEVLELGKKFSRVCLESYGRVELEKGIVEGGQILDRDKLKEKIVEVLSLAQPHKLRDKKVIFSLPESKTFLHLFELPADISSEELKSAVEGQAAKTIPLLPEEVYSDFQVVSRNEKFQEILYASATKGLVNEYLTLLREIDLEPLVLDLESASLARAFKNEELIGAGLMIIDIGNKSTVLTVYDKGFIRMSSIVPVAGNYFTKTIAQKLNISFERAEEIKRGSGLDEEKEGGRIVFILQDVMNDILAEAKSLMRFYEDKTGRKVKKILLCGGSSFMAKITSYFSSNLDIKTSIPNPFENINIDNLFKNEEIKEIIETKLHPVYFANVVGLAERGLEKDPVTAGLNLIPAEKRKPGSQLSFEPEKNSLFNIAAVLIVSLALSLAFSFFLWVVYSYILIPFSLLGG